jgi:hypothetical protein
MKKNMPEWTLRIYYDSSMLDNKDDIICRVECMKLYDYKNFDLVSEEMNEKNKKLTAKKNSAEREVQNGAWFSAASKSSKDGFIDNVDFCDIQELPFDIFDKQSAWSAGFIHAAMWNWLPLGDSFVDFVSFRNIDAVLSDREYVNVKFY